MAMTGRKAVFFSLMAFLLITILVLAMKSSTHYTLLNKAPVVENRIYSANSFVKYAEEVYLPRALAFSSRSALEQYTTYVIATDKFDSEIEFKDHFYHLVLDGTIDGTGGVLNSDNLTSRIDELTMLAGENLKIQVTITPTAIDISQSADSGAWQATVTMTFDAYIDADAARWQIEDKEISTQVSIIGLFDPYYSLNANSPELMYITPTNYSVWNFTNFEKHLDLRMYSHNVKAPSFLSRLLNDTSKSSDCCGIESFINKNDSFRTGGALDGYVNTSFVDYCYFSHGTALANPLCNSVFEIIPLTTDYDDTDPSNFSYPFRVDPYNVDHYNLTPKGGVEDRYND